MAVYTTLEQSRTIAQGVLNIVENKGYEEKVNLKALAYKDNVSEAELADELKNKINTAAEGAAVTYQMKSITTVDGFASSYQLQKTTGTGTEAVSEYVGDVVNIPKDIFVQDVSDVLTADTADTEHDIAVGDKYVVFTVDVTGDNTKKLYLNLRDLVDAYSGDNKGIVLGEGNVFSLKVDAANANGLEVTDRGMKLNTAVPSTEGAGGSAGAMTAADKEKLNGLSNYTHPAYTALTGSETANATPAFGETFNVTQIVTDELGSVVSMTTRTVTIPNAAAVASTDGVGGSAGLMSAADKEKLDSIEIATDEDIDDLLGDLTL